MIFKAQTAEERRKMILNGNILNTLLFLSVPTLLVGAIQAFIPLSDGLFLTCFKYYDCIVTRARCRCNGNDRTTLRSGSYKSRKGSYSSSFCFRICYRTYPYSGVYRSRISCFCKYYFGDKTRSICLYFSLFFSYASRIYDGNIQFRQKCGRATRSNFYKSFYNVIFKNYI